MPTATYYARCADKAMSTYDDVIAGKISGGPFYMITRGQLAYIDSFAGLVPCKVLSIADDDTVTVRVTAARRGYARGEVTDIRPPFLVKRSQVFTRRGQPVINGRVIVVPDDAIAS